MFFIQPALIALFGVSLLMVCVWAAHLRDEDASIIDPFWGVAIVLVAAIHALAAGAPMRGGRLLVALVASAWALRLAMHLRARHRIEGPDRRYQAMREARGAAWWWQSFFVVFLLQAVLAWIVALPLLASMSGSVSVSPLGALGLFIAVAGFGYEAVADGQLARFKSDPSNQGKVMRSGLWGTSRHPNYFGEAAFWAGITLVSVSSGAWWGLFGFGLIVFMLLKVSGVTLTEQTISERRPDYAEYVRNTSAFIPWPRRQG
ncbi:DUF1295 domain-containing protein [bacterium]|nr:DUF1295 domain-containing protein [Planctomycetota bacterium]MDB4538603.1 DUF1295 domain-containing protein [bacterium]MDB4561755.1 DUF1295 domain-containing protein [bacterium]